MKIIEVFRTSVSDRRDAEYLLDLIRTNFPGSAANFDLDDCDHVLRVLPGEAVPPSRFVSLLNEYGFEAEELSDEVSA